MIALYFIFNLTTNIKSPGLSISVFFLLSECNLVLSYEDVLGNG